jgi:RNA polymerase sigma-70 factor (ECF subfamily)
MRAFKKLKCRESDVINTLSNILKNIAAGDKNAMKELYDSMSKDIYTFLLMFCKDKFTAEDALQETLISIYENAGSYRVFKNPKAWILTIAKNKAVSIIRKNAHTADIDNSADETAVQTESTENIVLDKIQADMLLSVLSEEDKKIVILHTVYGFKHREIAEIMEMPPGTVAWRYKQSIEKMKNSEYAEKDTDDVFTEKNKQNEVIL